MWSSAGAEFLCPVLKLGLNYSQSLEKMAARRPITLEGNVQQGSVLLWIIRRLRGERFSLSEAAAICVPAVSAGLYITASPWAELEHSGCCRYAQQTCFFPPFAKPFSLACVLQGRAAVPRARTPPRGPMNTSLHLRHYLSSWSGANRRGCVRLKMRSDENAPALRGRALQAYNT